MGSDNVELARRLYKSVQVVFERVRAGEDITAIAEWSDLWHPDAVVDEVADFPDAGQHRGHEAIQRWMLGFVETFDEISIVPQEYIPAGECVVVPTSQRFRSKAGLEAEWEIVQVWRFRDGKVTHAAGYRDRSEALKSAGLA